MDRQQEEMRSFLEARPPATSASVRSARAAAAAHATLSLSVLPADAKTTATHRWRSRRRCSRSWCGRKQPPPPPAATHLRAQVSHITSKCFTLCISGAPGKSLGSYEQACLSQARARSRSLLRAPPHSPPQCALRFLESNEVVISRMSGASKK